MERLEMIDQLISYLMEAEPEYREQAEQFPETELDRRYLLRALMNVWDPRRGRRKSRGGIIYRRSIFSMREADSHPSLSWHDYTK